MNPILLFESAEWKKRRASLQALPLVLAQTSQVMAIGQLFYCRRSSCSTKVRASA